MTVYETLKVLNVPYLEKKKVLTSGTERQMKVYERYKLERERFVNNKSRAIIETAKAYGMNRTSIYKIIRKMEG